MSPVLVDSSGRAHNVLGATIYEPISGVWVVNGGVDEPSSAIKGACALRVEGAEWRGTIDPEFSGEWGGGHAFRLLAGAGGWGKRIGHRGYHNDGGVKGRTVATDAARDCGETLGSFDGAGSLGADYARPAGTASSTLEDAAGLSSWWVGRDGVTRVGTRTSAPVQGVLDWDPSSQVARLEANDLAALEVGATLTDPRIGDPRKIRDLEIRLKGDSVRVLAWCGGGSTNLGRLPRLLQALVQRITEGPLWGSYRYRVVSMAPDGRVNLQVVRKADGIPDLLPVRVWPGIAGAHAELAGGAEVLVEFEGGDRGAPYVAHFTPKGGGGFVPESLSLCGGARPAAAVGDQVTIFISPGVPIPIVGTVGVGPAQSPFVGTATFSTPMMGVIGTGSARVKVP